MKETIKITNYFNERDRVHEVIRYITFSAVYIIALNFGEVEGGKFLFEFGSKCVGGDEFEF